MDLELTEEQQSWRNDVIRFAQKELNDDVIAGDRDAVFPRDAWERCARFGILGLCVPDEYGGSLTDPLTIMLTMEALGYGAGDNGLLFSLNAQMWACETPLVKFGTEGQKARYLPGLCDGSQIAAHAMSEPGSGSDAFNMRTTARAVDGGFVLDGSKTFVTNAPVADLFIVFASTDRDLGFAGLSAFLIDRDTDGLTVGSPIPKMGLRTSPMGEVFLEGCKVGEDALLGPVGAGMAMFNSSMEWERSCILASAVGTMQRQLERSLTYAKEREQFGQRIGKFQAVAHKIVDMKLRTETARQMVYRLGWLMREKRATALDSALVKLYISDVFVPNSLDAVQIHGGYGYMTEYEIEREVRDAVGSRLYSGTSEIQRNIIASMLGL